MSAVVPRLWCLVDATDDLTLLTRLAEVGVGGFQVRAKRATTAELLRLTRVVLASVRPYGARVVVDDRLDVALAAGADGVHLGADDLPVHDARALADASGAAAADGTRFLVGGTCRDRAQVEAARDAGADYVGFGPVRATTSKTGLPDPLGVDAVARAAGVLPLVAIGGLDVTTVPAVRAAGAHGVAVIGAIWRPPDPLAAAEALVRAV